MTRAATSGRLDWRVARLTSVRDETATARTLVLDVPGWPGHLAGQHVDVRLTTGDGYRAERSYSIASAADGTRVELTVQRIARGAISPYLDEVLKPGDPIELRGPIGGWFTWHPDSTAPLLLLAGGSGIVPLMSIIRTHGEMNSEKPVPVRLIYSVAAPADVIYASELNERASSSPLTVSYLYTRAAPPGAPAGRINAGTLAELAWHPDEKPATFVCGPTGFVASVVALLAQAGHDPVTVKTERFRPTGT